MIELRKSPRINVLWRAVIKVQSGKIIAVKIINISQGGLLIQCPVNVDVNHEYHVKIEIPSIIQGSAENYQVPCKVLALHSILKGDIYQLGVKFSEISDLHENLFNAWLSLTSK